MKNFFLTGFLVLFSTLNSLLAQPPIIPPNMCAAPPPTGAFNCKGACVNCNIDGYFEPSFDPNPVTVAVDCNGTPMTITNARWYAFIAGTTSIAFQITPEKCLGDGEMQGIVVNDCTLDKLNGCQTPTKGPFVLSAFSLIPGNVYQICIGGAGTSVCSFSISVIAGLARPLPMSPLTFIDGPTKFCAPFSEFTYSIPPVSNAAVYTWTAPPGASIDGGGPVKSFRPPAGTSVTIRMGSVGGNVCVRARNYCDADKFLCKAVTIEPVPPPTVLPTESYCLEETPYTWPFPPFTTLEVPGFFNLISDPIPSYLGCDSFVRQQIIIRPQKIINYPLFYLCEGECFKVGGQNYCDAGNYQVSLTAANGCDSIINFSLAKLPALALSQLSNTLTCNQPTATLTSNGSTTGPNVTYNWYNGSLVNISNQPSITASAAGNYYLIVSNSIGSKVCRDTAALFLPASLQVPAANAGPQKLIDCLVPSVQLSGSGATGGQFSYQWTASNGGQILFGGNTLTPTVNAVGTYTLVVLNNSNGCSASSVTSVVGNFGFPAITAAGGLINCNLPSTTLTSTSNAPNSQFLWSGPNGFSSTLQNPPTNTAGQYTVQVTDPANGCKSTASATVNSDFAQPTSTISVPGNINCSNATVNLTANSSGGTGYNFVWKKPDGTTVLTGSNPNLTADQSGIYTLTTTNTGNGCTSTTSANVNTDFAQPSSTVAVSANLNCQNAVVNLSATATGGTTYNFSWKKPDGSTVSTGSDPNLSANAAGQYILTTTNTANGCTSTTSATVNQSPAVATTVSVGQNVSCFGGSNGTASAAGSGGNGSFTFLWSNGQPTSTISNLTPGNYSVVVTDGEGCTATGAVTISQPDNLLANASATGESTFQGNNGTATANPTGGTPNYTYSWSNGETTQNLANLPPGSYLVTITDANGCTSVQSTFVNVYNCSLTATLQTENVSCFGANNGSATITVAGGSGGLFFNWSNGLTGNSNSNLPPGDYSVDITDEAECPAEVSFTISEPTDLQVNFTVVNASGGNPTGGSAAATPTGGTPNYTYLWSNGETTQTIQNLTAGSYILTLTDANGCTEVSTAEVGLDDCGILATFVQTQPTCFGLANGSIQANVLGGAAPLTFDWSDGSNPIQPSNLAAGTYFLTISDAVGCSLTFTQVLEQPAALQIATIEISNTICPDDPAGSATVAGVGGTGNIQITWGDGQTGMTANGLTAGPISVQAVDANNCATSTVLTIGSSDTAAPAIVANNTTLPLGVAGQIVLTTQNTGISVSDNCLVETVQFAPASFNCSNLGMHTVVVTATDGVGNVSTAEFTVEVVDNLAPQMFCPANIYRCAGDDVVFFDLPSVEDNCSTAGGTFAVVSGLATGSQFPPGATVNSYTFTDAAGNVGSCSFQIVILDPVSFGTSGVKNDIDSMNVGSIDITVLGGLAPYTFTWTKNGQFFSTDEDLKNIGAGIYTVKVVDTIGCTTSILTFEIQSLVDTDEPNWATKFQLVPNPTSGWLTANFPSEIWGSEATVVALDATGRLVFNKNFKVENQVRLDLSFLPDGLYLVSVRLSDGIISRRIVVSRD